MLDLAYAAGRAGGTSPVTLSAANEVAVDAFLAGRLPWARIADIAEAVLDRHDSWQPTTVDDVVNADAAARAVASGLV